ncbi:flagellar basal body-associated protein FliL [Caminibacter pacificus]|uniref:Flagellar protein FliL n=1 Tax=Caminibacter pacificus TaxID=1424653 RepID=A0AAJ4RDW8_9BACT|nr:flagellar basal body-associated protein FliL [Caminibacter pacificus]QCI28345.1 flagellar basal body-associated protein FliL [Caminibacter pacificus]ROR40935.1 flagellar FliL protein [Caminibacter pacificus]
MAEEKENKEVEEKEEKSGSGNKLLLIVIIVLLLLLLIIGGLVAYFLLSGNDEQADQPQQQQKIEKKKKVSDMTEIGPIYPLDKFVVNLVSTNADRYLKCKIDLELDSPELQQEIDKKLPAIRDLIIRILSSKTVEEIQTSKGKEKLKEEIKRKINEILTTGEVRNVYFTEFVIQ